MHRSGTSALTRVVSLMGATLPKRLMGAGGGNEAGHWEPERLVAYHDQMLAELGSAWHDFKPLDLKAVSVSRREAMTADIREILEEDYGDAPLIVVKDPRICRFAPFFSQAAGEAGYDVATVLTFRNPLEVIDSLMARRDNWPKTYDTQDAALLWLAHNLEAERASREFPRAVVSYDGLIGDWKKPVSAIAAALENPFANALDDVEAEVSAFIDERQRHHTKRQEDVLLDPRTAGWVSDCYSALRALEAGRNVLKAKAELDRVHAEFITTLPVLQQTVEARRKTAQEKQVLDERLARVEAEAEEKERILAEHANVLERERDGSHGRVQSLTAEVAQAKKKIAQLECEASQARARRDAAGEDAARDREKARAAEARFSQAQAEIADLRREIAAREKLLADERQTAAKLHEQLTAELETERAERQAREQQTVSLQAMLAEERSQGEARIAELEKMAAEKDAKIGDLERDGQESQAHITGLQQEVEEKTGRIAGLERDAAANADLISGLKQEVEEKTGRIAGLERDVEHRSREVRAAHTRLQQVTQEFRNSTSWKLTAPLRAVKYVGIASSSLPRALTRTARVTLTAVRFGGGVRATIRKVMRTYKAEGLEGLQWRYRVAKELKPSDVARVKITRSIHDPSGAWIHNEGKLLPNEEKIAGSSEFSVSEVKRKELEAHDTFEARKRAWKYGTNNSPLLSANVFGRRLQDAIPNIEKGLVLSVSHDNYREVVGGVQLCVQLEERQFINDGFAYLNVHPREPSPSLAESSNVEDFVFAVVANGRAIGEVTASSLIEEVKKRQTGDAETHCTIHALLGHSPEVIINLLHSLGAQTTLFWIHDYFALCPNYNLLRNDISFCGAPSLHSNSCNICLYGRERATHLKRIERMFDEIDIDVISPSHYALQLWRQKTKLRFGHGHILPHLTLTDSRKAELRSSLSDADPIRIAFMGYPTYHKGWPVFLKLAERFADDPRYEFHHLGQKNQRKPFVKFMEVKTSAGNTEIMTNALVTKKVDVVLLWPAWPETFSFTFYEALAGGVFVVTNPHSGNIEHQVRQNGGGVILSDEQQLYSEFEGDALVSVVEKRRANGLVIARPQFSQLSRAFIV